VSGALSRQLTSRPSQPSRLSRRGLPAAVAACAVAASVALAGCSGVDHALGQQWAVVNFHTDTKVATLLQVRAACSRVPHVRPLPASDSGPAPAGAVSAAYSVRYQVSDASAANLESLRTCLQKFPSVAGVSIQDVAKR
jgi:hypothetical protein